MSCPPRRPARASASTAQSYPCLPPVLCAASPCARRLLPVSRGKGGYWQGASACRARRVALRPPARVPHAAYPCAPRVLPIRRGKGGYWQRASACPVRRPPRRPARRPPASPVRPNPAHRGFCPPRRPARRMPCPPASRALRRPRSPCGLSLRAAGSARRQFLPALRGKGGYWQGASACRARRVTLRPARRRVLPVRRGKGGYWQGYSARPSASSARPNPARRGFCPPPVLPALRGKGGYWQRASACPVRRPPRRPARASASAAQSYPCLPPAFSCAPPPASPVRINPARRVALRARPHPLCSPIPACRRLFPALRRPRSPCGLTPPARVPRAAYPCAPPASARAASGCIRAMP